MCVYCKVSCSEEQPKVFFAPTPFAVERIALEDTRLVKKILAPTPLTHLASLVNRASSARTQAILCEGGPSGRKTISFEKMPQC